SAPVPPPWPAGELGSDDPWGLGEGKSALPGAGPPAPQRGKGYLARSGRAQRLYCQGKNVAVIAAELGVPRSTVRHYLRGLRTRDARRRGGRRSEVEPWRPYLEQRGEQGVRNGRQLWREILAQGFGGSPDAVGRLVAPWRATRRRPGRQRQATSGEPG